MLCGIALMAGFGLSQASAQSAAAQSAATNPGIDFSVRLFDRQVYHVGIEPILVQVTIANNSPFTYRFRMAEDRAFSVDFEVRSLSNRLLEPAESLVRRRSQARQVFFRDVAIEPGESFSFVEDLRDFVRLDEPGAFVVRAFVHPELFRPEFATPLGGAPVSWSAPATRSLEGVLVSERIGLNVLAPVARAPDGLPYALEVATGAVLMRERLPPDEVVEYTIRARMLDQWERFFLYLDLDEMLRRDPIAGRRWANEGAEGRQLMADQFRQQLRSPTTTEGIALVPIDYAIQRTQHSGDSGQVVVRMYFRGIHFTEIKDYTYYLQRRDDVWTIVDLSVVNVGAQ